MKLSNSRKRLIILLAMVMAVPAMLMSSYVLSATQLPLRGGYISLTPAETSVLSPVKIMGEGRGYGENEFYEPVDVEIDSSGYIYVLERVNGRIQKFTSGYGFVESFGSTGEDVGQLDEPCGMTLVEYYAVNLSRTIILVADTRNHRVSVLSQTLNDSVESVNWSAFGERTISDPRPSRIYFENPKGIDINSSGGLYVADTEDDRISLFDIDLADPLESPRSWDRIDYYADNEEGVFDLPEDVLLSGEVMYVADTGNDRIRIMNVNGSEYGVFGSNGTGLREFYKPCALDTDGDGNLYVVDSLNNRIVIYNPQGAYITEFGGENCSKNLLDNPQDSPGQFCQPEGIEISGEKIYVADTGNHRIQVFEIPEMPSPTCTLEGNKAPCETVSLDEVYRMVDLWIAGESEIEDTARLISSWLDRELNPPEIKIS